MLKSFVVYKLFFDTSDKVYIGKTFDINKRIADHLYTVNVLQERTIKGNWMRKHLKLGELRYEIIFECTCEQEAYDKELSIIQECLESGVKIVNTQRFKQAGGQSKRRKVSSKGLQSVKDASNKEYIVIDSQGVETVICGLKQFAIDNNLVYKSLNSCASGKSFISQGYVVVKKSEWDAMTEEKRNLKRYIATNYEDFRKGRRQTLNKKLEKEFWILNSDGSVEHGVGIAKYMEEQGYNRGNLGNTINTKRPADGKILFYSEEEMLEFKATKISLFHRGLSDEAVQDIVSTMSRVRKFSREAGIVGRGLAEKYGIHWRTVREIYKKSLNNK